MNERSVPTKFECCENDYNASFWSLWPTKIDDDVERLNKVITLDNIIRKKNYQRPIRVVTKKEFVIFHALMIGAAVYCEAGEKLWFNEAQHNRNKRRSTLSEKNDFSKYMKHWRFKQIRQYIPNVMQDSNLQHNNDWWKFVTRVDDFNSVRKKNMKSSHVLVFDESMSAFILR